MSSELISRISREMDEVMNSVSVQIQRAINDAISNQGLPQIQNAITAGSGHVTRKGWNVSAERPETNSEVLRNVDTKDNSRGEHVQNRQNDSELGGNYDAKFYSHLIGYNALCGIQDTNLAASSRHLSACFWFQFPEFETG